MKDRVLANGDYVSSSLIRCPRCLRIFDPWDDDPTGDVVESGSHTFDCPNCGEAFGVTTDVSYHFKSWSKGGD